MKFSKLFMKSLVVLLFAVVLFTSSNIDVEAKSKKVNKVTETQELFEGTITLENRNTKFDIGFVRVHFKKDTLPEELYPITFEVKLYAEDGEIYIEFSPDVEEFFKDVKIKVKAYEGFIFDISLDEYIYVDIPTQVFKVPHFSRWFISW